MAPPDDTYAGDMSEINDSDHTIPNPMSINPAFELIAQPDGRYVNADYSDQDSSHANPRRFGG